MILNISILGFQAHWFTWQAWYNLPIYLLVSFVYLYLIAFILAFHFSSSSFCMDFLKECFQRTLGIECNVTFIILLRNNINWVLIPRTNTQKLCICWAFAFGNFSHRIVSPIVASCQRQMFYTFCCPFPFLPHAATWPYSTKFPPNILSNYILQLKTIWESRGRCFYEERCCTSPAYKCRSCYR